MPDNLIQWNMRSWRSGFCDLKKIIADKSPNCICLQETLIKDGPTYPPSGYNMIHTDRTGNDGHNRGVAILTRTHCHTQPINLNSNLQAIAIRIWFNKWYTVCSLYLPHSTVSHSDIQQLINQLPAPYIILGDMNARNETWGDTVTNPRGRMLEEIIDQNNISLLNSAAYTHFHVQTGTSSIIDLALCSSDCVIDFSHEVLPDLHGSDHFPIQINIITSITSNTYMRRFKVEKANWTEFHRATEIGPDQANHPDITDQIESINNIIITAAKANIPQSKGNIGKTCVPWWDSECQSALVERRRAQRALQRNNTISNLIAFKRTQAICKKTFKEAKKLSWQSYVSTINSNTSLNEVWKKVRKLEKISTPYASSNWKARWNPC